MYNYTDKCNTFAIFSLYAPKLLIPVSINVVNHRFCCVLQNVSQEPHAILVYQIAHVYGVMILKNAWCILPVMCYQVQMIVHFQLHVGEYAGVSMPFLLLLMKYFRK